MRAVFESIKRRLAGRTHLIAVAGVAVLAGLLLSAGYATAVQVTSSPEFCAHSCHEMERTVYAEYAHSKHYKNGQGAVATCAQCHAPQNNWSHAMWNEVSASSRVWAHLIDREYLPGRFEARRPELAKKVLAGFKASNARECRACHAYANMVLDGQSQNARRDHSAAMKTDANCLDCHQGVAHKRMDAPASYDFP